MYKVTVKMIQNDDGIHKGDIIEDTFIQVFPTEIEVNAYILAMREIANFYMWDIEEQVGGEYATQRVY